MAQDIWDRIFDVPPVSTEAGTNPKGYVHRHGRRYRKDRNKRADIQGLRAVAVIAVVVNHLTNHPQGGFVGVDVFFVISGYLITGLLLRDGDRTGTISWINFYKGRIRRLLPAALTVTGLTIIAANFVFTAQRFHDTLWDAASATLFAANWRLIHTGTDYFQAQRATSPMQHYWSLSVEEQFYVVWPVVLLLVFLVCKKLFAGREHATRATGTSAAVALTAASLFVAWQQNSNNAVVAYFSTFTRGWELGLGAILAVTARYVRGGRLVLTALSWTGLALIVASLFFINQQHFPFPGAIAPCLGSVLVIIAQSDRARAANLLLTNKVANYIGDISYSVYLVHFPVIIFAGALVTDRSVKFYVITAALIVGLSMSLFELLEDPIRQSSWLRRGRAADGGHSNARSRKEPAVIGLGLAVLALAAFVISAPTGNSKLRQINTAIDTTATRSSGTAQASQGPAQTALTAKLAASLKARSWPSIVPAPGDQVAGKGEASGCAQHEEDVARCTFGNKSAKHTIYLVGDSTSIAYEDAFIDIVTRLPGWKVRATGGSGCPFSDTTLNNDAGNQFAGSCPDRNKAILAEILRVHPDVLIETSASGNLTYQTHIGNELAKVKSAAGKIVILPAPPVGEDPTACYTKVSTPSDCVSTVSSDYRSQLEGEQRVAAAVGGLMIDPTDWYSVNGYSPMFVEHTPMRRDRVHISPQYAAYIAPVVQEALVKAKVLP